MFHLTAGFLWCLIAWRWAHWREWKLYYPTILYMIVCDLLYNALTDGDPLWEYTPTVVFPDHLSTNIFVMLVIYPASILLYLSRFPKSGFFRQAGYMLLWAVIYSSVEWVLLTLRLMRYLDHWNLWMSSLFNIVIFAMLRLHAKKTLLAIPLSILIALALWRLYHFLTGTS